MRRIYLLIIGIILIAAGGVLYFSNASRIITLNIDGEILKLRTSAITAGGILKEAGVAYTDQDKIFPRPNFWMTENYILQVNHQKSVHLQTANQKIDFQSYANRAANILADAGILIYPGDQIFWNDIPVAPDYKIGNMREVNLRVASGQPFTLVRRDGISEERVAIDAEKVEDALEQQGIEINQSMRILPDAATPFSAGMTIKVLTPVSLRIVSGQSSSNVITYGTTVGEALQNAGFALQGADYSIPAESTLITGIDEIQIVHVQEEITLIAEIIPNQIEWIPDDESALDSYKTVTSGSSGLKGSIRRIRMEDGAIGLDQTSPETQLSVPLNEVRTYGTKVTTQTLETSDGVIEYWRSVPVYATSYSPCRSGVDRCINGTASGRKVEKGVVAVDGDWYAAFAGYPVYVPDYGFAVIGDTGRSPVADNRWIDLAYNDQEFVPWSGNTTLYFLTPVPSEIPWILP